MLKTHVNTEGPHLTRILGLAKTVLHEIRVSGTVGGPLLTPKSSHLHVHKPKTVGLDFVSPIRIANK